MTTNVNAQARKAAMVRFINENGGKATMKMKINDVIAMHNDILAKNPSATTDRVVLGTPKQEEVAPKMLTMTEVQFTDAINTAIAQAQAPLMSIIGDLTARIEALMPEQAPVSAPAPVVEAVPAPVVAPAVPILSRDEIRAEYDRRRNAVATAKDALSKAYRKGDKAAIEVARKEMDDAFAAVTEMGKNMALREHIADYFYSAADSTRTGGHKAVDAVANVMHKGVDMVANTIEATGRMIDTKPQPVAPAPAVLV